MTWLRIVLSVTALLGILSPACALHERIDSPMYRLPDLSGPAVIVDFPAGLNEIWLRALARPEAEMRLKAAASIALARDRGVKELDACVEPLIAALDAPEKDAAVRLAIARSLVALDANKAAPSFQAL